MPTDRIDIRHVARLARLALTDDEIATFAPQLGSLMTHVDALAQLETENVPATAQVVPSRNVQRADTVRPETILAREGTTCAVAGTFSVSNCASASTWVIRLPSCGAKVAISSSVSASRASRATWRMSIRSVGMTRAGSPRRGRAPFAMRHRSDHRHAPEP